jgi:hypothetical protein
MLWYYTEAAKGEGCAWQLLLTTTIEETPARLPELLHDLLQGEEWVMTEND